MFQILTSIFSIQYNVLYIVQIELQIGNNSQTAELTFIKEDIQTLLGHTAVKALEVLQVGLNAAKDFVKAAPTAAKEFLPKLKDFQLQIPIHKSIPPVIQPFHRIVSALHPRVEEEIIELLRLHIIERVEGVSA